MKNPVRVGAAIAPKTRLPIAAARPDTGRARRIANLSAAAALMLGIGAASAVFVDYLADRALARNAHAPAARPVVAKAVETSTDAPPATEVASLAPEIMTDAPEEQPDPAPIEARLSPTAAVAEVPAAGPEHAIEEPTDDPTASPIVHVEELGGGEEASLDEAAHEQDSAIDEGSDQTETTAIEPDEGLSLEAEPVAADPVAADPVAKPKKSRAKSESAPAPRDTQVASLPGVDIGGLAGHPSDDSGASESTVQTITKPAAKPAKAATRGSVTQGSARVTQAVNLRSSPKKGASVLGVVPASTTVSVLSCDGWCQISYNGRKGWVYKSFLAASKTQKPDQDADAAARKVQSSRL
ncbi:MAG: SH3 domain-containing protein [Hyphomicrobiales bacterium]|nr:SH3 domain-containing protein [Hyphomicrobiales bacterium]